MRKHKTYLVRILGGEVFTVALEEAVLSKKELTKKKIREIASKALAEEDVRKLMSALKMKTVLNELVEYGEFRLELETGYTVDYEDHLFEHEGRILRESKWTRVIKEDLVEGYHYVKKYYKDKNGYLETYKEVIINPLLLGIEIYELES